MPTTATLVRRIDSRKTLLSFSVGEEVLIPPDKLTYAATRNMAQRLEKEGYEFKVKLMGTDGTLVKRIR